MYVQNADTELRASGANVVDDPVSRPWGPREFHVLDLQGIQLILGQPIEGTPPELHTGASAG